MNKKDTPTPVETEPKVRKCLTYDGRLSNVLTGVRSDNRIQVLAKPNISLQKTLFTKLKIPFDLMQRKNVVYEIPCDGKQEEECDLHYVGQTKKQLKKRLAQQRSDLKSSKPKRQSAVISHFEMRGHFPAFDKATVLGTETFYSRRNTLESLHICSRPTYNLRRDTDGIAASYVALLETQKRSPNNIALANSQRSHATRARVT